MVKDINLDTVTPLRSLSSINDDMYAGAIPANNNIQNYYELVGFSKDYCGLLRITDYYNELLCKYYELL